MYFLLAATSENPVFEVGFPGRKPRLDITLLIFSDLDKGQTAHQFMKANLPMARH